MSQPSLSSDEVCRFLNGQLDALTTARLWKAIWNFSEVRSEVEIAAALMGKPLPEFNDGSDSLNLSIQPATGNDYALMFDRFDSDEFLAYNAPFQIEFQGGFSETSRQVQLQRYHSLESATYLFSDHAGFSRAHAFFSSLSEQSSGSLGGRVRLICVTSPSIVADLAKDSPCTTYFAGYHGGSPRCVGYEAVDERGMPVSARVVEGNANVAIDMLRHFDYAKWLINRSGQIESLEI